MKATSWLLDSTVHSSIVKVRLAAVVTDQSRLPYTLAPKNNFESGWKKEPEEESFDLPHWRG